MVKLLERSVATAEQRLVVVAPSAIEAPSTFRNSTPDSTLREALLRQIQRLRGTVYLEDGAIRRRHLTADGRHCTPDDGRSWHMAFLNAENRVSSAIWMLPHAEDVSVDDFRASKSLSRHT